MKNKLVILLLLLMALALPNIGFSQSAAPEGYIGIVSRSDARSQGESFRFANLSRQNPIVMYPSGNATELKKVFEDNELIVLFFVADITGSTETYYLNKKSMRFTIIEVGALEATVEGKEIRPKISVGKLQPIVSLKCRHDTPPSQMTDEELCNCLGREYNRVTKKCE